MSHEMTVFIFMHSLPSLSSAPPQLYLTSLLPLSFPITSHIFPPLPALATRYTQKVLYCCLTEFDIETETQAGGKTQ